MNEEMNESVRTGSVIILYRYIAVINVASFKLYDI